jgi:hypothetical protein
VVNWEESLLWLHDAPPIGGVRVPLVGFVVVLLLAGGLPAKDVLAMRRQSLKIWSETNRSAHSN